MLAALLETAKAFAAEHMRAEESKTTWNIDGRKDVEELVGKTAHRVRVLPPESGSSSGGRAGHGDGVGEVRVGRLALYYVFERVMVWLPRRYTSSTPPLSPLLQRKRAFL